MKLINVTIVILLCFAWNKTNAQMCPECKDLLNPLLMDRYNLQVSASYEEQFARALRLSTDELTQLKNSSSTNAGISIPVIDVVLGLETSSSSEALHVLRESFSNDESRKLSSDEAVWLYTTSVKDDIPKAFNECMQICANIKSQSTSEFRIETIGDKKDEFIVIVHYATARSGRPASIKLVNPTVTSNLELLAPAAFVSGNQLRNGSSLSQAFKRKDNNKASIAINLEGESAILLELSDYSTSKESETRVTPPPPVPVFLWYDLPGHDVNSMSLKASVSCLGCPAKDDRGSTWPKSSASTNTSYTGHHNALSEAAVEVSSEKNPADKTTSIRVNGKLLSHAGFGDQGVTYRPATSKIEVNASTGFEVPDGSQHCLMIADFKATQTQAKRDGNSHLFPNSNPIINLFRLIRPSGDPVELVPDMVLPLDESGVWKINISGDMQYYSGWHEDSGSFTFDQILKLKIIRKYPDGSCPN